MPFSTKYNVQINPLCNGPVHLSGITLGVTADVGERQGNRRSSAMRIINATAWSGFARRTAESASDFASVVHNLFMDVRDSYRPELHYMRGPGPKWRAKHQPWLGFSSEAASPAGQHQLSPLYVRRHDAASPTR